VYRQDIPEEEYEVICVDDCSPDNSIAIVEEYAKNHTNIVIVRNQYNRKLGGARNAGMEVAKGEYIWFIDSDDFIETNCFQKLLHISETYDLDVLHFNYSWFPKDKINQWEEYRGETDVMTGVNLFFDSHFIWFHDLVTAWRKLYKRSFLCQSHIQFAEHIMFEDNDYAIEVFAKAQRTKHIPDKIYFYRDNPDSITRVKYTSEHVSYWLDLCHRLVRIKDLFKRENKDERFQKLIMDFIRYVISNVLTKYTQMDDNNKKRTRTIIRQQIDEKLKPYISRSRYYKIKLGVL
jgi:glycosyltransferase involved in cell wall biosynthesis